MKYINQSDLLLFYDNKSDSSKSTYRFPVIHSREKNHQLNVDGDQLEVERGGLEVDGDVQWYLTRIDVSQEVIDVVFEVEQVNESVVVERQGLDDLWSDWVDVGQWLEVHIWELPINQSNISICWMNQSYACAYLTTVLMLDSSDLSERKDGLDLVSPHAFLML